MRRIRYRLKGNLARNHGSEKNHGPQPELAEHKDNEMLAWTLFVDFFEKIMSPEKHKPGSMSRLFSDHPLPGDRIQKAQEVRQKYQKPEYVVSTSEFNDVKARVQVMHKRCRIDYISMLRLRTRRFSGSTTLSSTPLLARCLVLIANRRTMAHLE
jgi:hypothetical protein